MIEIGIKTHELKIESLRRDILKCVIKIQSVSGHDVKDPVQIGWSQMQCIDSPNNEIIEEAAEFRTM